MTPNGIPHNKIPNFDVPRIKLTNIDNSKQYQNNQTKHARAKTIIAKQEYAVCKILYRNEINHLRELNSHP